MWRIILLTLALCSAGTTFAAAPKPDVPPAPPRHAADARPSTVKVRTWTSSGITTDEAAYSVDLKAGAATLDPSDRATKWEDVHTASKKRDRVAYARLEQAPRLAQNDDLAEVLKRIDGEKASGYPPEEFIFASPDGKWAVYASFWNQPLLLIDLTTLEVRRLLDDGGDSAPSVAWADDSQHLAIVQPKKGEIQVYDVKRQAVTSHIKGVAPQVVEVSWSPDGSKLAVVGLEDRRLKKTPLTFISAGAGHPVVTNNIVLQVYRELDKKPVKVVLKHGVIESTPLHARIAWK